MDIEMVASPVVAAILWLCVLVLYHRNPHRNSLSQYTFLHSTRLHTYSNKMWTKCIRDIYMNIQHLHYHCQKSDLREISDATEVPDSRKKPLSKIKLPMH